MFSIPRSRFTFNERQDVSARPEGPAVQLLEARTLFAAVWTGASDIAWSNRLNWSPQEVPADNASIVFPAAAVTQAAKISTPVIAHSIEADGLFSLDQSPANSSLTVDGGISTTYASGASFISVGLNLAASQTINVENNYLRGPELQIGRGIGDGGQNFGLTIDGGGTVVVANRPATYTGPTTVASGNLKLFNTEIESNITVRANAEFSGYGTVHDLTALSNARLLPGADSPRLLTTGNLTINSAAILVMRINGGIAGSTYDQLVVNGTVSVGGALASITTNGAYHPLPGNQFTLIQNDGTDAVAGTFAGLPEGGQLRVGGMPFRISYVGGTGNDVVLTALTTPSISLVGSGPTVYGAAHTFTVQITGGFGTPAGTVSLLGVPTTSGNSMVLDGSGQAIFNVTSLPAGTGTLVQATYNGGGAYAAVTSSPESAAISKDTSTSSVALTTPATIASGQHANFQASIVTALGGTATGNVAFFDGQIVIGTASLDASGVATLDLTTLGIGHHSIITLYSGDGNVIGATSTGAAEVDVVNSSPTTSGISNVDVRTGDRQSTIDLGAAFDDVETSDANLIYTITGNTNVSFLAASITGQTLTLNYPASLLGSGDITVRATDANGDFVETTFNAAVSHIPASGTLQFASAEYAVSETAGSIDLVISRSGGAEGIASAHYAVTSGSATAADDFTLAAGTVTFGDGEVSKSITVAINNDAIDEDDETAIVTLSSPSGVTTLGAVASTTITIHDNAAPTVGDLTEDHRPGQGIAPSPMYTASDADNDPLTLSILTPPQNGTATVGKHPSGDYILYYPAPTLYGDDSVVYQVDDGHGHTATGTLHLTTRGAGIVDSAISPGLKDLVAIGDEGDDDIEFYAWKNTKEVKVMIGDGQLGHYPVTGRVLAFGMGGNDTIRARYIKQSTIFSGGDGNDRLIGSGGKDILVGGDGNDRLQGYEKMDLFIGGAGTDRIDSGAPDDIAIGGTTAFDALTTADQLGLVDIVNAWNGSGKRTARQIAIGAGVGASGAKLDTTTVFADNVTDDLGKVTTKNWIFGDTAGGVTSDLVRGRRVG